MENWEEIKGNMQNPLYLWSCCRGIGIFRVSQCEHFQDQGSRHFTSTEAGSKMNARGMNCTLHSADVAGRGSTRSSSAGGGGRRTMPPNPFERVGTLTRRSLRSTQPRPHCRSPSSEIDRIWIARSAAWQLIWKTWSHVAESSTNVQSRSGAWLGDTVLLLELFFFAQVIKSKGLALKYILSWPSAAREWNEWGEKKGVWRRPGRTGGSWRNPGFVPLGRNPELQHSLQTVILHWCNTSSSECQALGWLSAWISCVFTQT